MTSTVSTISIVCICISLFLSLLLPIIFLLILQRGRKGVFGIWLAGVLGFAVPQLFIRIPVLQVLSTQPAFQQFTKNYTLIYALALALTAGLFETFGRLIVLRFALSKKLSYMTGLAAGAGHGAIESITIVGLAYINNLVFSLFINSGRLSAILPDPKIAASLQNTLTGTAPSMFLYAGFERIFTMMFHIALSVLIALFILRKHSVLGFLFVTLIHFAFDFFVVFMQLQGISTPIIEGVIAVLGIASLIFTIKIRPLFGDKLSIPTDKGEQAVEEGY